MADSPPPAPATDPACRNCGAASPGRYCPSCGQETALALPTAGAFLREAAGRYVALDGRLARTLFHLSFQPGFLTREYLAGRRKRYIRPARLFLVLALALFAVLRLASEVQAGAAIVFDDGAEAVGADTAVPGEHAPGKSVVKASASEEGGRVGLFDLGIPWGAQFDHDLRITVLGPGGSVRDRLQQRIDRINRLDRQDRAEQVQAGVLRYGPYALIALLPWFALLLQVVYAGRRRRYPQRPRRYAERPPVFGAHNHALACLMLIVTVGVSPWQPVSALATLWMFFYLFVSLKNVYGGRWSGVIARGAIVAVAYLTMFGLVTVLLLVTAILLR